jgi:hypothetical protein
MWLASGDNTLDFEARWFAMQEMMTVWEFADLAALEDDKEKAATAEQPPAKETNVEKPKRHDGPLATFVAIVEQCVCQTRWVHSPVAAGRFIDRVLCANQHGRIMPCSQQAFFTSRENGQPCGLAEAGRSGLVSRCPPPGHTKKSDEEQVAKTVPAGDASCSSGGSWL